MLFEHAMLQDYAHLFPIAGTESLEYKGGLLSHELSDFQAELEPPIYIMIKLHERLIMGGRKL